jgi:hypothetical protein
MRRGHRNLLVVAGLLAATAAAVVFVRSSPGSAAPPRLDAMLVYCPADSPLPLVVIPAAQPRTTGSFPLTSLLLSGTAGAALTFGLVEWRNARERRRARADRLRVVAAGFRRAVRVYVDQQRAAVTAHPDPVGCLEQRDELQSEVAKLLLDLRRRGPATTVVTKLADPSMIDALTATSRTPAQRSAELGSLSAWALDVEVAVERLARTVEGRAVRDDREVARR